MVKFSVYLSRLVFVLCPGYSDDTTGRVINDTTRCVINDTTGCVIKLQNRLVNATVLAFIQPCY